MQEMTLTEEEAKTKWCPFASVTARDANGCGTYWNGEPAFMCIASACMAWRPIPKSAENPYPPEGYCGLAGKP